MVYYWAEGPMTVRQLLKHYPEPAPHFNTVATLVRILVDKGFLVHVGNQGGAFVFAPAVKQSEVAGTSLRKVVRNYFNNSYRSVVSSLVNDEKITVEDLREIIDMIENKKS